MKLALVNPSGRAYTGAQPVNLMMLAAYIRKFGHEVKIIDIASGGHPFTQIDNFKPDLIGVTSTTMTAKIGYYLADEYRKKGYKVALGGAHASAMPEESLKHADVVVVGEGEIALKNILEQDLSGIIKGELIQDLDEIPIPAYDLVNMEYYLNRPTDDKILVYSENERVGNILTSRGCPNRCTFCHNSFKGLGYRANSPKRVLEEIVYLIKNYMINAVFFIEDNFFVNKKRVIEICRLLQENKINIPWGANARVNNIDDEVLAIAKKAGCRQITFGWESGSQRMLDIYKKDVTVEQNVESIKMCERNGILANGTLMIGGLDETFEDIQKTRDFLVNNSPSGGCGVCITTPFPATVLWTQCVERGLIDEKCINYDDFDFSSIPVKLTNFTDEQLNNFCQILRGICGLQRDISKKQIYISKGLRLDKNVRTRV